MQSRLKKILFKKKYLHDIFNRVFSSPEGKEVLMTLIKECRLGKPVYEMGMSGQDLAFLEGQRRVVQSIITKINERPDFINDLLKETEDYVLNERLADSEDES